MEVEKYSEIGEYCYQTDKQNNTQIFLAKVFSKDFLFEGYELKFGDDSILDFKQELYEWFEIYKKGSENRLCFGFWDENSAMIRWFIEKDEVDLIKSKLNSK